MSPQLEEVLRQIDRLSTPDRLEIINYITDRLRDSELQQPQRKWLDLAGTVPYPLLGEDAQTWVSRSRRDDRAERDRLLDRRNERKKLQRSHLPTPSCWIAL